MKIAICDDEQLYIDNIVKHLDFFSIDNNIDFEKSIFTNSFDMLASDIKFDIAILDVEMDNMNGIKLGAIEAGGTKFVVCIGNEKGEVLERESFPTEAPEKTMENVFKFFDGKEIEALGVGSFGPIDPDLTSPTYGYITTTPKPGWNNYNIMGALKERYDIPMAFDTDVNGAALGEATFGVAKGLDSALYLTIGTGIGGGAVVGGKLVHGLLHPEMGHMKMIVREDDTYSGKCPYHGTCFEGLAAGLLQDL